MSELTQAGECPQVPITSVEEVALFVRHLDDHCETCLAHHLSTPRSARSLVALARLESLPPQESLSCPPQEVLWALALELGSYSAQFAAARHVAGCADCEGILFAQGGLAERAERNLETSTARLVEAVVLRGLTPRGLLDRALGLARAGGAELASIWSALVESWPLEALARLQPLVAFPFGVPASSTASRRGSDTEPVHRVLKVETVLGEGAERRLRVVELHVWENGGRLQLGHRLLGDEGNERVTRVKGRLELVDSTGVRAKTADLELALKDGGEVEWSVQLPDFLKKLGLDLSQVQPVWYFSGDDG